MSEQPKNVPELAAGLVSPEYAAEHPMLKLKPIADRSVGDIGAAFDAILSPPPRRHPTPRAAAYELLCVMAGIDEADPQVFSAVRDALVDWFASWEKGGLSLCLALDLVDYGEIEDWAHDHGWRPPD